MKKFMIILVLVFSSLIADTNNTQKIDKQIVKADMIKTFEEMKDSDSNKSFDYNKSKTLDLMAKKIADSENNESNNSQDKLSLISVVSEIVKLNSKLIALQTQGDANQTAKEKDTITTNKQKLFDALPVAITKQSFSKEGMNKQLKERKELQNTIKIANPNSLRFAKASMGLETMKIRGIFYSSLLRIEDMFVQGTSSNELKTELEKSLKILQDNDLSNITSLKEKLSPDDQKDFESIFVELLNEKNTYEEILEYLLENHDLLASDMLLTGLKLNLVIEAINSNSPIKTEKINVGKAVVIVFIIIFFYSFKKLITAILYYCLNFFNKNKKTDNSKEARHHFIKAVQRSVGAILLVYAANICLNIASHPAPIPIKISSAFSVVYILLYAWLVVSILNGYGSVLFGSIARKSARKEIVNLIIKFLYIIIFIIALLLILKRLGFNISTLLASLGIGGIAIAFATKDIIANFFNSIMLLFDNSFSQGDRVCINGIEGDVVEIGLKNTMIRTVDNVLVFVPNSTIAAQNIQNWSRRKIGRQIKFKIGVEYSSKSAQLKNAISQIKQMLIDHPGIAGEEDNASKLDDEKIKSKQHVVSIDNLAGYKNAVYVALDEFADSSINILVYCYTKSTIYGEFLEVKEDILFKIMEIIEQNGLNFAFPSQSLYVQDGKKSPFSEKI